MLCGAQERAHRQCCADRRPPRGADRAVYSATKYAVWAITEGLRQEHDDIRATIISPGVVATELGNHITDLQVAATLKDWRRKSLTPDAIVRAINYTLA